MSLKRMKIIGISLLLILLAACSQKEENGDNAVVNSEMEESNDKEKNVKNKDEDNIESTDNTDNAEGTDSTKDTDIKDTDNPEDTDNTTKSNNSEDLPSLTLIGHASVKIKTKDGIVVYIDPYWPGDYTEEADLVLVTHGHSDHADLFKITKKDTTRIISRKDVHPSMDQYDSIEEFGIKITAVPAYNNNHEKESNVGYILEFDDIKLYHAGDTSKIDEMEELADLNITYALFPTDGEFNMGPEEATEVANLVGAKVNISIHNNEITEEELFKTFTPEGRLFMEYGSTIILEP